MKTKVVICGASGFIGRNIAEKLAERDDLEVFGTYFKNKPALLSKKIKLIQADLTKIKDVDKVIMGKDIIIQASAVTSGSKDIVTKPYMHVTDNAVMNSLIFRSAFENKLKHVVFFSCTVMYPNIDRPVKEEDFNYQITDKYFGVGWTKVYLEKMCEFFSKISKTKYTAIRHSNIYGPFDKYDLEHSHVFGATITKIMTAKDKIVVWGDGSEARDLLYVSDLVDFVELILKHQKTPFELVNVGFGSAVSVANLVKKIIEVSGKKIKIEFDISKPTIKFSLSLNLDKAKKVYNWKPKVTIEEGIKKTISWYQQNIS
ncbi:MAG: NAD-dependent epimerase/dehydratase family protein [Candidatus Levyibacteriota bacterium]|nr:MAG: NAD-dependent epimerase/dehydratase family protein [Candidatus Levybacteria bacterium]